MGLDISYYSAAVLLHACDEWDEKFESDYYEKTGEEAHFLWAQEGFPHACHLKTGFYDADYQGGFRAGSYSGYNLWRNTLAQAVLDMDAQEVWDHGEALRDKPFWELINFSDCEGTIAGPSAVKLAQDFEENRSKFRSFVKSMGDDPYNTSYYMETYEKFAEAFKVVAATDGFLDFH